MGSRAVTRLAWSLWALCVSLVAATALLYFVTPPIPVRGPPALWGVGFVTLSLAYPTVGAVVASRRPKNPIGWILCAVGLVLGFQTFAAGYADYGLLAWPNPEPGADDYVLWMRPEPLPGARYMAWLASWVAVPVVTVATVLLLLLFPEGRLPSGMLMPGGRLEDHGWRVVVWMAALGSAMVAAGVAARQGQIDALGPSLWAHVRIENPLAVSGTVSEVVGFLAGLGWFLVSISGLFAGASLISRRVLARGEERQQLKWFTYAAALTIFGFPATLILVGVPAIILFGGDPPIWDMGIIVGVFGFLFFPIAVGIGILRYRLYDIDLIINRTLVYGALSVILVLAYVVAIVLSQGVFRALTGQKSQLAVVASTLAIAALISPLRRRVQEFVDRRFYRSKYDARKTLEAFSVRLRDETDLATLDGDLVGVVRETMQPEHVSLWLRPTADADEATENVR
jgi:hypothetical protein